MVMNLKNIFVIVFLLATVSVFGQKPDAVLPGNTKTLAPTTDTLWVLSNADFKKTIIAARELKLYKNENVLLEQEVDSLKLLNAERQSLIDTLKSDRDFYVKNWKTCEDDLNFLGELNQNQAKRTRIAIIVGASTTVTAFIVGFILGIK